MKPIKLILTLCLGTACLLGAAKVATVVEKETGMALEGATAFGRSGRIVGQTDADGRIHAPDAEFPLTIRCMGYQAAILPLPAPYDTLPRRIPAPQNQ